MKTTLEHLAVEKKSLLEKNTAQEGAQQENNLAEYVNSLGIKEKEIPKYTSARAVEYNGSPCTSCGDRLL